MPPDFTTLTPITQILILPIPTITKFSSSPWTSLLALQRRSSGFVHLYWGRQVETPENVVLHIVKARLHHHTTFASSDSYKIFTNLISLLTSSSEPPRTLHAHITTYYPPPPPSPLPSIPSDEQLPPFVHAPVTGTAKYLSVTPSPSSPAATTSWQAYTTWSHLVRTIPGFVSISGGPILERIETGTYKDPAVKNYENNFIALVGWKSIKTHNAYHHTQHFLDNRWVLDGNSKEWTDYGHVDFKGEGREYVEGLEEEVQKEEKSKL